MLRNNFFYKKYKKDKENFEKHIKINFFILLSYYPTKNFQKFPSRRKDKVKNANIKILK